MAEFVFNVLLRIVVNTVVIGFLWWLLFLSRWARPKAFNTNDSLKDA